MLGLLVLLGGCRGAGGLRDTGMNSNESAMLGAPGRFSAREPSSPPPLIVPDSDAGRSSVVLSSAVAMPDAVTRAVVSGDSKRGADAAVGLTGQAGKPAPRGSDALSAGQPDRLELTLQDAVQTGLMQNPDLVALRTQEGVSLAALGVAETYPWNPNFQAQYLGRGSPFDPGTGAGTGAGKQNVQLIVMQQVELAQQQRYRAGNAAALLNQARWTIRQAELTNIGLTTQLYFTALYQKQIRDLDRRSAALNEKLLGVVERRFKGGLATAADVATAKVSARQAKRQAKLAEANYQTALLALRRHLNVPVSTAVDLAGSLADFEWLPVAGTQRPGDQMQLQSGALLGVATRLVEGRPDVLAASAGMAASHANMDLARAARVPDLQIGPMYQTGDNGVQFAGVSLQIDIPVWNTGAPLARQRHAELYQQSVTYDQLKQKATQEAVTALDRYERARRLVAESRVDLSPLSANTPEVKKITEQFLAGQANILAVFLIQNNLIQEQRTHLAMLNELAQAAAGVIQATGLPPQRLVQSRKKVPVPPKPAD